MKTNYRIVISDLRSERPTPHVCDFLLAVCRSANQMAETLRTLELDLRHNTGNRTTMANLAADTLEAYDKL